MIVVLANLILLSTDPGSGLCVDSSGTWYTGAPSGITRWTLKGGALERGSALGGTYSDEIDIYVADGKMFVVDYSKDFVECRQLAGKTIWKAGIKSANATELDESGNMWAIAEGGSILKKTPNSSTFEPMLNAFGEEVVVYETLDIAPSKNILYTVDYDGDVARAGRRLATIENAQRILRSTNGVLVFASGGGVHSIVHVSDEGSKKTVWNAPPGLGAISHFSRISPGKVLVAGPREQGGFAMIVDVGGVL